MFQEAKGDFKQLLLESVEKIKHAAHKLSNSIQTAKPYYEARLYAAQVIIYYKQKNINPYFHTTIIIYY